MGDSDAGGRGTGAAWEATRHALERDVRRVADRLRGLSQSRLAAPVAGHRSRADAAREVAQTLADAAAGVAAGQGSVPPVWRPLPVLSAFAVGDQVAVTGHDLLAACADAGPQDNAWARHGRRTARDVVADAEEHVSALRHLL